MITVYETRYYPPSDNAGAKIKVTNTRTRESRLQTWDWAVNGGHDQHMHAVHQATALPMHVVYGGETKHGYLWVATQTRSDDAEV